MQNQIQYTLLLICLFAINQVNAQIINIPDASFKAKLLEASPANEIAEGCSGNLIKIDANSDNNISVAEAEAVCRLHVENSNITSLTGIEYFKNLEGLTCYGNLLTNLNASIFPNLQTLNCNENKLISLNVSGLSNLENLYCAFNQLTNINLDGLFKLETFLADSNKLTNLYVNHLSKLTTFNCSSNLISSLNISGLSHLIHLGCPRNSRLNSIFMRDISPMDNWTYFNIANNPSLNYICTDSSELTVLRQKVDAAGYPNVVINSLCSATINTSYYTLHGKVKIDLNNNGCTSEDANFPNLKFIINNATDTNYIIADEDGNFDVFTESGTYSLTPLINTSYFTVAPQSAAITLPDTVTPSFCIVPKGVHDDLYVTVFPISVARPGFSDAQYKIVYKNKGTSIQSGTITFNYDENRQDYISATVTPTTVDSGEIVFNFANLAPFESGSIIVTLRTNAPGDNPPVNSGDVLNLSVTLNLANGVRDDWFKDNFLNIKQTVTGSFDPNDKICLEGSIILPTSVGDFINYLIRFENTGTANAENIVVTDYIDLNKFDINTLEFINASHSCRTVISNGNKVQFVFDNIQLPFTDPNKHGYVAFQIKTKNNLVIGDSLKNNANIYFDYNLPVATNTASSRIDNITGIKNILKRESSLSIYPNPGNGQFTIQFELKGNYPVNIKLFNESGRIVFDKNIFHNNKSSIDILQTDLPAGLYQLTITSEKESWIQKVVIVK